MDLRAAPPFIELGFHTLAFVPAPEPGSLHDPRYTAWCRAQLPVGAWQPADLDARLLAALAQRAEPAGWQLQHLPFAYRDLATLRARGTFPVATLDPREAIRSESVVALRRLASEHEPLVELARTAMACMAPDYAHAHATVVASQLDRALEHIAPALTLAGTLTPLPRSVHRAPDLCFRHLRPNLWRHRRARRPCGVERSCSRAPCRAPAP